MTNFQELTVATPVTQGAAATAANHLVRLAEAQQMAAALFAGLWSSTTTYANGVMVSYGNGFWISLQAGNLGNAPVTGSWWLCVLTVPSGGGLMNLNLSVVAGATLALNVSLGANLTGQTVNFVFEPFLPVAPVTGGYAIDLTDQTPQTRTATITDALNGKATYQLTSADTAAPGIYRGQFQFTSGGVLNLFPDSGWIEFEVTAAAASGENYFYTAWASDLSGTGFSLTPSSELAYMAVLITDTELTAPEAANFAGLWFQAAGSTGAPGATGATGAAGASSYAYVGWASDASGTGFSLTPGSGLYYAAILVSPTVIATPGAGNFAGLWANIRGAAGAAGAAGANGTNGTNVYGYAGYATDASGDGFSPTPGVGLNYIAFALSATPISPLTAAAFTGWKLYAADALPAAIADTDDLAEGTVNLYFTPGRVIQAALTGLSGVASGSVLAADTILTAIGKLNNGLAVVAAALASPAQALYAEGQIPVWTSGSGVSQGTLGTLSLGFTPARVLVTLQIPSGGTVMPLVVVGAPTTTGFSWKLGATVSAAGYWINYRMT